MYVVCVRLNCVCMFCCDVWFDVVWSGLIVCVCARVCYCHVVVRFVCDVLVAVVLLLCCCVCDVC